MFHRFWKWFSLVLIVAVAALVRFQELGAKSLWLDEALSWRLQSFPIALMMQRTGEPTTVHPPLYFGLLHGWTAFFGDSEVALRSLSAAVGTLAVVGLYFLTKELLALSESDAARTEFASLLASALLGVSPFQGHLSRQVRSYSLGTLLLVASSFCLIRALRAERRSQLFLMAYAVMTLAFCYTHNLAVFSVAAQGLFAVLFVWRRDDGRFQAAASNLAGPTLDALEMESQKPWGTKWPTMLAFAAIGVGYVAWLPHLWGQSETLRTSWNKVRSVDDHAREVFAALLSTAESRPIEWAGAAWGVTVLVALVIVVVSIRGGWAGLFVGLAGLLPVVLLLAYSAFSIRNVFGSRYLAFAQPLWLISLAIVVSWFHDRIERFAIAGLVLAWSVYGIQMTGQLSSEPRSGAMSELVQHVVANVQDGERVVAQTPFEFFKWSYYLRRGPSVVLAVPERDRRKLRGTALLLDEDLVTVDELLQSRAAGLWLVTSDSYDRASETKITLSDEWERGEQRVSQQEYFWEHPVKVTHYRRR